jgi:hypothetical protein
MKGRCLLVLAGGLLAATLAVAATNLNSSRSNIYRVTYAADVATPEQVRALLAELDRMGPADAARLKQWLPANFRRFGIAPEKVKKIVVLPPDRTRKETAILILGNPADEPAAMALTVKGSKSNTSE